MAFLLDANVFIQAKNEHYGMDFCPAFSDWLRVSNEAGTVASVAAIAAEIRVRVDELSEWTKRCGDSFFLDPDAEVLRAADQIGRWVTVQHYTARAINRFTSTADHLLVAHALAKDFSVVSHEKRSTSRNRVKIPDVCLEFHVECISPFEMLRRSKARFELGES